MWKKEGNNISKRSFLVAFSVVGVAIIVAAMVQTSPAGKTITFHSRHMNVATTFNTVEVGDKLGQVAALFQAKGVSVTTQG